MVGCLVGWLAGCWLAGWLVGLLVGRLLAYLVGWLAGRLIGSTNLVSVYGVVWLSFRCSNYLACLICLACLLAGLFCFGLTMRGYD